MKVNLKDSEFAIEPKNKRQGQHEEFVMMPRKSGKTQSLNQYEREYLKSLELHRKYVREAGVALGLPEEIYLNHDLSKFTREEFLHTRIGLWKKNQIQKLMTEPGCIICTIILIIGNTG